MSQLGSNAIKYLEIENFEHSSFSFGRDMSYLDSVMGLIKKYNPLPNLKENPRDDTDLEL